jgi:hypothetical protein
MSNPYGPVGRFPSINQDPTGAPEPEPYDPPGYYRGWRLAGLTKRCMSGFLDYGLFVFMAFVVGCNNDLGHVL